MGQNRRTDDRTWEDYLMNIVGQRKEKKENGEDMEINETGKVRYPATP